MSLLAARPQQVENSSGVNGQSPEREVTLPNTSRGDKRGNPDPRPSEASRIGASDDAKENRPQADFNATNTGAEDSCQERVRWIRPVGIHIDVSNTI